MVLLGGCIKPNWPDIDPGSIDLSDESIRKGIADPSFRAFYQIRQMLSSGLTIRDNFNAAIVKIPCIHGVEVPFSKGTINGLPIAFTPLTTSLSTGGVALPVTSTPIINYARTDGYLGLTVSFAPPEGIVDLLRAGTQSIPSATSTPIQWTSDELSIPLTGTTASSGNFSYDYTTTTGTPAVNSKINCLASGSVLVNASCGFGINATGLREFWLAKNNATSPRWSDTLYQSPPVTTDIRFNLSGVIQVTAGDYIQLYSYQDSGGALTTLAGTVSRFQARYVSPQVRYSADVTGILWGG